MPTRKTTLVVVLLSFLPMTNSQFFIKSPLASPIMLFRLPISSIPHSHILSILKLLEIHSKRLGYTLPVTGKSATKKKVPMLKKKHHQRQLKFAQYHENYMWRVGKGCFGHMREIFNRIGSDGKVYIWKKKGEQYLTRLQHQLSNMKEGITL